MLSNNKPVNRKEFLELASMLLISLSGLMGLTVLLRFFKFPNGEIKPTVYNLGSAEDFPLGTRVVVPEAHAIIFHTVGGFQAFSLDCPHLGCQVEVHDDGFTCPCHGSQFDASGKVLHGPADHSLDTLVVDKELDGSLILVSKPPSCCQ